MLRSVGSRVSVCTRALGRPLAAAAAPQNSVSAENVWNHNNSSSSSSSSSSCAPAVAALRAHSTSSAATNSKNKYGNHNKRQSVSYLDSKNVDIASPWYHQICAFDDSVNQILTTKQYRRPLFSEHRDATANKNVLDGENTALFWDSITRAVQLYNELIACPDMNPVRVSSLINAMHNALRINRFQMVKLNKKPDYDSNSFNSEMIKYLTNTLRSIATDILDNKISINEYGLMHLLTSFKELLLEDEAVQLWKHGINSPHVKDAFLAPKTVGVMLPILYKNGSTFQEIKTLYETSSQTISYNHPNLMLGMIDACLLANENVLATEIFNKLCQVATQGQFTYIVNAHLSFIANCHDIPIAQTFWEKALSREMPYKINLQVSSINKFIDNIWNKTSDFERITHVWLAMVKHYNDFNLNLGILSSLNNKFFDIFFNAKYGDDKLSGFKSLQQLIEQYQSTKLVDEPFLNIILTKSCVWNDIDVVKYLEGLYSTYQIPQTIVTKRILLKSMGSIDQVSNEDIWERWLDLINKLDSMGHTYIANADWAALRDATVHWTSAQRAVESNSNADDDSRITLYLQIVKLFRPYCRDTNQESRITRGYSNIYPVLKGHLSQLDTISTDGLAVPPLNNLEFTNNHL